MLQRVLEPELMDTLQAAMEYDAMDHQQVNAAFVDDLIKFLGVTPTEDFTEEERLDIMDVGTGTARIPILLAQRLPQCRIMATDAAVSMLDLAKINVDIAQLIERVQLARVDAKDNEYPAGFFHVVMSNSIIHHIPEPLTVLRECVRVTDNGGWLFFRDLLRPESEAELEKLVQTYCGQETPEAQQLFADSLRAALSLDEIRELVKTLGFAPETVQQTSDRHWTWAARKTS